MLRHWGTNVGVVAMLDMPVVDPGRWFKRRCYCGLTVDTHPCPGTPVIFN